MSQSSRLATSKSIALAPKGLVGLVLLLFLAVVLSAIAVVTTSHHSRISFGQLEFVRKQGFDLKGEASRISLEYKALAGLAQIQSLAEERLDMQTVTPSNMVVLE